MMAAIRKVKEHIDLWLWGPPPAPLPDPVRESFHRVNNKVFAMEALVRSMQREDRDERGSHPRSHQ